jgi:CheY-like chemotaxis protein
MGARVVVIEDNPTNLELMMYLLKALGHLPTSAIDGSDGLEVVRALMPDLVLCDVQLPRVDGFEVARRMKSDPRLAAIPLIAVTAFAMPGDRERAFAAGFNGYISKPISPEMFFAQIGAFLAAGYGPPPSFGPRLDETPRFEHPSS